MVYCFGQMYVPLAVKLTVQGVVGCTWAWAAELADLAGMGAVIKFGAGVGTVGRGLALGSALADAGAYGSMSEPIDRMPAAATCSTTRLTFVS